MSTEDRVRAATRARTALVRDIRPLELPAEQPGRFRRPRSAGRWLNWGAPVAAAALVVALALVLVLLRQAPGPRPANVAPTSAAPAAAAVPRYYVVLDDLSVTPDPNPSSVNWKPAARPQAVVADDRTGRVLASVPPPSGQSFTGVTAAADDRTFVLTGFDSVTRETTWYLLRFTPGAADPAKLEKLPVAPLASQISGLALSPDGHELAVMFAGASLQLRTYSVGSGALLGTWQTGTAYWTPRTGGANAFGLSWLADGRRVSFRFDAYAKNSTVHLVTVRTLDVAAAGHDLLADSRLALQEPLAVTQPAPVQPCFTSLAAPDGNTVVCGTFVDGLWRKGKCISAPVSLISSSATGGKVLYRNPGSCQTGWAVPLWTNASARDVITGMDVTRADTGVETNQVGVITAGRFTQLRVGLWAAVIQSDTIFPGNIAF